VAIVTAPFVIVPSAILPGLPSVPKAHVVVVCPVTDNVNRVVLPSTMLLVPDTSAPLVVDNVVIPLQAVTAPASEKQNTPCCLWLVLMLNDYYCISDNQPTLYMRTRFAVMVIF